MPADVAGTEAISLGDRAQIQARSGDTPLFGFRRGMIDRAIRMHDHIVQPACCRGANEALPQIVGHPFCPIAAGSSHKRSTCG